MKTLDTRDLNERLEELKGLRDAVESASGELDDAKAALDSAKAELEELKAELGTADESNAEAIEKAEEAVTKAEEELEAAESAYEEAQREFNDDEKQELDELDELESEISGWADGETLIPESDFVDYVREMLEDCGDVPKGIPGYVAIDWDKTADNVKADYSEVTYQGETYLVRSC